MRKSFPKRKKQPIKLIVCTLCIALCCVVCWITTFIVMFQDRPNPTQQDMHFEHNGHHTPSIHINRSLTAWNQTLPTIEIRDLSSYERIIVIGDLHGDFEQAIKVLTLTKLINSDSQWIAHHTILIQTGDIVDRGPDSLDIYALFLRLKEESIAYGSLILNQLGNHEHLNFINDFTYVNLQEIEHYGGFDEWKKLMSIRSDIGYFLRNLPIARIIGNTLFAHAGVLPSIAAYFNASIVTLNEVFHAHVMNMSANADINPMSYYQQMSPSESLLVGVHSPIWTRYFAPHYYDFRMTLEVYKYFRMNFEKNDFETPPSDIQIKQMFMCNKLRQVLEIYAVKRMIIGHNLQTSGSVASFCTDQLYLIDVGMSTFYGGNLAAIEIDPETEHITVITDPNNPPKTIELPNIGGFKQKAVLLNPQLITN